MTVEIINGDAREWLEYLPEKSIHCCVTSPPYFGLRDYGTARWEGGDSSCNHDAEGNCPCGARRTDSQVGLEATPDEYVADLVSLFREVKRVLRDDGTFWLNVGDSYARNPAKGKSGTPNGRNIAAMNYPGGAGLNGLTDKQLLGMPWRLAFALQADGWVLRSEIIWHKPNPMPESVRDRCTKAHETIFMFAKTSRYYFDAESIREDAVCKKLPGRGMTDTRKTYGAQNGGNSGLAALRNRLNDQGETDPKRNKRSVWTVATKAYKGAHFATFPVALIEPCILAGCPEGGTVLDPFGGAGTTGLVSQNLGRNAVLIELNPDYAAMARQRIDAK